MTSSRTCWLCRELHAFLPESYLEIMAEDYGIAVKVCELDCDSCKERHDKVLEDGVQA